LAAWVALHSAHKKWQPAFLGASDQNPDASEPPGHNGPKDVTRAELQLFGGCALNFNSTVLPKADLTAARRFLS
jgi:hypothetical protein